MTTTLRIDHEHEILTGIIECLEDTCSIANATACTGCPLVWREKCADEVWRVMNALASYMQEHFRYEEAQMDGCLVEDQFVEHRHEHRKITAQVQAAIDGHNRKVLEPGAAARALAASLTNWLDEHVEEQDALLAVVVGEPAQSPEEAED